MRTSLWASGGGGDHHHVGLAGLGARLDDDGSAPHHWNHLATRELWGIELGHHLGDDRCSGRFGNDSFGTKAGRTVGLRVRNEPVVASSKMRLSRLLSKVPGIQPPKGVDPVIQGVTDDSRKVGEVGCSWPVAARTSMDTSTFPVSWRRAASALVVEDAVETRKGVVTILAEDASAALAHLCEAWCEHPTHELDLVGVTGTNGKTTVTWLIHQLVRHGGIESGLVGTVGIQTGRLPAIQPATMTTPPAPELSALLADMVDAKCKACLMEVSSHALDQRRVDALQFSVAVFTNLTGDHLDYHQDMANYAAAKARLFELLDEDGTAIVNIDDQAAKIMISAPQRPII